MKLLKVGMRVVVFGQHEGTVRYIGPLDKLDKHVVVGVEFDSQGVRRVIACISAHSARAPTAVGKCDGSWHHARYFQCKDLYGDFVLPQFLQV